MSLFGFGKKENNKASCGCSGNCPSEKMQSAEAEKSKMEVKILGGGCARCNQLEAATRQALSELGMNTDIEHVRDYGDIAAYGVMTTPALVINGKVVSYGKVLKKDEIVQFIKGESGI